MRAWLLFAVLILSALCVLQGPFLKNHFISDEYDWIRSSRISLDKGGWLYAFTEPVGVNFYRPIVTFSFQIDYSLFGYSVLGYRIHHLLLHFLFVLASSWMVFVLFGKRTLAFAVGALAAAYPSHHEVITWFAGRPDLLASLFTVFSVGAFGMFLKKRKLLWLATSLLAAFLGFLSKEAAFAIPLLLLGVIPLFVPYSNKKNFFTSFLWTVPFFVLLAFVFVIRSSILTDALGGYQVGGESASLGYTFSNIGKPFTSWISLVNWRYVLDRFQDNSFITLIHKAFVGTIRFWFVLPLVVAAFLFIIKKYRSVGIRASHIGFGVFWSLAAFVPVYGISGGINDALQFSRLFFLSSLGICLVYASILTENTFLTRMSFSARYIIGGLILGANALLWFTNIQPWVLASQKAEDMVTSLEKQKSEILSDTNILYVQRMAHDVYGAATFYANSIAEPFYSVSQDPTMRVYYVGGVPYQDSPFCSDEILKGEKLISWNSAKNKFDIQSSILKRINDDRNAKLDPVTWDLADPETTNALKFTNIAIRQEAEGVVMTMSGQDEAWVEMPFQAPFSGSSYKKLVIKYSSQGGSDTFGARKTIVAWGNENLFLGGSVITRALPAEEASEVIIPLCEYMHWNFSTEISTIRIRPLHQGSLTVQSITLE